MRSSKSLISVSGSCSRVQSAGPASALLKSYSEHSPLTSHPPRYLLESLGLHLDEKFPIVAPHGYFGLRAIGQVRSKAIGQPFLRPVHTTQFADSLTV